MTKILLLLIISFNIQAEKLSAFELPIYKKEMKYQYSAKTKTLINFWASWCTSCIQEIPELEALKKENPKVEFLAVNAGDSPSKIKKFLKKTKFSYTVLMDKSKKFSKELGVLSLPITMVISKKGEVLYRSSKPPKNLKSL